MKKKSVAAALLAAIMCVLTACGVEITGLSLPESLALEAGESAVLSLEYKTETEATQEQLARAAEKLALTWTSSDEAVATVAADGTVTAVGPGRAEITAGDGALSAVCPVTVGVGVTGLDAPETLELQLGKTERAALDVKALPAEATDVAFTYGSSDEAVATVAADGTVTAVGEGECTVTVQAEGFKGASARAETKVTVTTAVTGIALSSESGRLTVGSGASVRVYTQPEAAAAAVAGEVTYTVADENIAAVSGTTEGAAGFTVKGIAAGTTTVAVEYRGLKAEYTVTVVRPASRPAAGTGSTGSASGAAPSGGSAGGSVSAGGSAPSGGTPSGGGNTGTGVNPNAGGAAGQGQDYVIPGDGSWAVDGGNAEFDEGAVPPPPIS